MEKRYIQIIAEKQGISAAQVGNVLKLHGEGATIPFMARYRKEATGNLDEVKIAAVVEGIGYFTELDARKDTVVKTIEAAGKMNPELRQRIEHCLSALELEDIYLPFKPKRKTRATKAIECGLEPLASVIFAQEETDLHGTASKFIGENVNTIEEALQGARDIIAEWIAENEQARNSVRKLFAGSAEISSRIVRGKKESEEAQKYRDYFEFSEPFSKCPSHRMLAIRRGEKEGFLSLDIYVDPARAVESLKTIFIKGKSEASAEVSAAIADSYDRLLKPSIENEFRLQGKNAADEEAIRVFAENLRQLLLAPPLGSKRVMAIDPGFRTGCKVVCLDEQGNLLQNSTIFPHPPRQDIAGATAEIARLAQKYSVEAIGIGNGTAGRETEHFLRSIDFGRQLSIFMVNESGASIYSASEVAREEFPDEDVTVRGAISIGRRLLDPLSELVKIDAKSIGVGQYQHDVNQVKLKEELDRVVESCVNYVGVDVNTASRHILGYISGLSATLARNIVEYRRSHGPFANRNDLKNVPLMGPKSFEQSAGFMRIPGAAHPLDRSAVHPESYFVVEAMAKDHGVTVKDLMMDGGLRKKIDRKKYVSEKAGEFTIEDILKELEKPGRDPREKAEEFRFDETIRTVEDVKPGMMVPGIVTNITKFGVFVDIGVKQDGLLHVSQMSNRYVADPSEIVRLGQHVRVTVTEVDVARKRISLSMKDAESERVAREKPTLRAAPKSAAPRNDFEARLMELKKKFTS